MKKGGEYPTLLVGSESCGTSAARDKCQSDGYTLYALEYI